MDSRTAVYQGGPGSGYLIDITPRHSSKHRRHSRATEFERLLGLPHAFLFNRQHYLTGEGAALREEYEGVTARMSESQRRELLRILSGPTDGRRPSEKAIASMADDNTNDALIRAALRFHAVNHEQKATPGDAIAPLIAGPAMQRVLSEEERVEDAGLYAPDPTP